MSEILEAMKTRRSVRSYKPDAVPNVLLDRIVEAGLWAASGMNRQSVVILKITDKALRDELSKMNAAVMGRDGDPFYGAPVVFVVLADKSMPTYIYDGSLALGNMMLEAHECGLGSCWIHRAKEEFETPEGKAILERFGVKGDFEGIGHLIVGYTDGEYPAAKTRNPGRVFEK